MKVALDKNQQSAVYTNLQNVLVVAAPGSGKTTVIINRVNYLIEKLKVFNSNIYVITFTRAAADNMRNRYKNLFNRETSPFFGTFHGLFYKILLKEGYEIKIINGAIIHNLIKRILMQYLDDVSDDKIREVISNISNYKTTGDNNSDYKSTISNDIFNNCYEKYEEYKSNNNLWDFDDLSLKVLHLLKDESAIRNKYKKLFKYVLVDEFQDCDQLQIEFLKLINENNNLYAVGDEDQCIYSFRGSKPEYMVDFHKTFMNGKKIFLTINYRSKKNIVDLSKKLIEHNRSRNKKEIEWFKKDDGLIKFSKPTDETIQATEIAKAIKERFTGSFKDNGVIFRTNIEVRSLIDVFTRERLPFVLLDKGYNFFEHFIAVDILNYLRLAINSKNKAAFASVINKPFRYISKSNINFIKNNYEDKCSFDLLMEKDDTPPFQCKKLTELKSEINYLNKISLSSAIQYIVSSLGYSDYLREYANRYGNNFDDLDEVVEEFKQAAKGFKTIRELLVHVDNVKEEIENSKVEKDGVILSTIHGVKGMEFKNIFLINCVEDIIPHKSSVEINLEEERRLFYVGITRAINNLFVYSPKYTRGKLTTESRFIGESQLREESLKLEYGIDIGDYIEHKTYGTGCVEKIAKDIITLKFSNDIARSFSLSVLMDNNLLK